MLYPKPYSIYLRETIDVLPPSFHDRAMKATALGFFGVRCEVRGFVRGLCSSGSILEFLKVRRFGWGHKPHRYLPGNLFVGFSGLALSKIFSRGR